MMTMHSSLRMRNQASIRMQPQQAAASRRKRDIRSGTRRHRDFSDMANLPFVDRDEQRRMDHLMWNRRQDDY
jgi:hypothetical protein